MELVYGISHSLPWSAGVPPASSERAGRPRSTEKPSPSRRTVMTVRKCCALFGLLVGAAVALVVAGSARPPAYSPHDQPAHAGRSPEPRAFGWIDDPDAVRECAALMRCGRFCETPAFAAEGHQPEDVYLW